MPNLDRVKQIIKGIPIFGPAIKSLKRTFSKSDGTHHGGGKVFYNPNSKMNAGYQSYFRENEEQIRHGNVPERYKTIAKVTPGRTVIELGSADGTQCLVLALEKDSVCGIELMPMQHKTAVELKSIWIEQGFSLNTCDFVLGGVQEFKNLMHGYDTVLMSRLLYHLRSDIDVIMDAIKASEVTHIVLVGCPERTRRFRDGGHHGDSMGKYAYYATTEGMKEVLNASGFSITYSTSDEGPFDPIVVGGRPPAADFS